MTGPVAAVPDPRPALVAGLDGLLIAGWRCELCGHPLAYRAPWCPVCRGSLRAATFGPCGVVWAATVVRVPLPGRTPPYGVTYVDVDDGPRVLAHVMETGQRLRSGARVRFSAVSEDGDVLVRAETEQG